MCCRGEIFLPHSEHGGKRSVVSSFLGRRGPGIGTDGALLSGGDVSAGELIILDFT